MRIEELKELRKLSMEIRSKYEILKEARLSAYRINNILSATPKGKNGEGFSTAILNAMSIAEEMKETVIKLTEKYTKKYKEAKEEIEKLEELQEKLILELRYLSNKKWDEIARIMNFSKRRIFQIHDRALKRLQ